MTREEAIKELKILKEDYWDDDGYGHETKQYDDTMLALDMAIKALEQAPKSEWSHDHEILRAYADGANNVLEKIRSEIQSLRNCSCSCSDGIIDDVEDIIDKYNTESEG